jgi:hypothetical protein
VWQDMGHGAAITSSNRARIESGRLIGQMVPDKSAGPNPLWANRTAADPAINARRLEQQRKKRRWNGADAPG